MGSEAVFDVVDRQPRPFTEGGRLCEGLTPGAGLSGLGQNILLGLAPLPAGLYVIGGLRIQERVPALVSSHRQALCCHALCSPAVARFGRIEELKQQANCRANRIDGLRCHYDLSAISWLQGT